MIIGKFLGISFDTSTEDSENTAKNNVDATKAEYKKIKKEELKSMPAETYTKDFEQHTFNNDAGVKALLPTFKNIPTESIFTTMESKKVSSGSMMKDFLKTNNADANVVKDASNKVR
jgi:hypothetical protein